MVAPVKVVQAMLTTETVVPASAVVTYCVNCGSRTATMATCFTATTQVCRPHHQCHGERTVDGDMNESDRRS